MHPNAFRDLLPPGRRSTARPLLADFGPELTADLVVLLDHYLSVVDAEPRPDGACGDPRRDSEGHRTW